MNEIYIYMLYYWRTTSAVDWLIVTNGHNLVGLLFFVEPLHFTPKGPKLECRQY
jgi:hypothetical protein